MLAVIFTVWRFLPRGEQCLRERINLQGRQLRAVAGCWIGHLRAFRFLRAFCLWLDLPRAALALWLPGASSRWESSGPPGAEAIAAIIAAAARSDPLLLRMSTPPPRERPVLGRPVGGSRQ